MLFYFFIHTNAIIAVFIKLIVWSSHKSELDQFETRGSPFSKCNKFLRKRNNFLLPWPQKIEMSYLISAISILH